VLTSGWQQAQDGEGDDEDMKGYSSTLALMGEMKEAVYWPSYQGVMKKCDMGYLKVWYKRLCRISEGKMLFGRKSSTDPLGSLTIECDTEVIWADESSPFFDVKVQLSGKQVVHESGWSSLKKKTMGSQQGGFELHHFEAPSVEAAAVWMRMLRETCSKKQDIHAALMEAEQLRAEAEAERERLRLLAEEEEKRLREAALKAAADAEAARLAKEAADKLRNGEPTHLNFADKWANYTDEEKMMAKAMMYLQNTLISRAWQTWLDKLAQAGADQETLQSATSIFGKRLLRGAWNQWFDMWAVMAAENKEAEKQRLKALADEQDAKRKAAQEAERLRLEALEEKKREEEEERQRRDEERKRREREAKEAAERDMQRMLDMEEERRRRQAEEEERARLAAAAAEREAELQKQRDAAMALLQGEASEAAARNAKVLAGLRRRWIRFTRDLVFQAGLGKGGPTVDEVLQKWWRIVSTQHTAPHRFHHTISRLAEVLELIDEHKWLLERPEHVELAVWFHNIMFDTAGSVPTAPCAAENAAMSRDLLSNFITEVDLALQRDTTNAGHEPAVNTMFDEDHPLSEPNEMKIARWLTETGEPISGSAADADGEYMLDFLLAIDVAGNHDKFEKISKRLTLEICPPIPVETSEERAQQYSDERRAVIERALRQRSLYRQEQMTELYEIQSRANLFSECEVLKFKSWATAHGTKVKDSRLAVNAALSQK